ncbi:MAG: hypothetical protein ABI433_06915 [Burkholderiaceae bacterium]
MLLRVSRLAFWLAALAAAVALTIPTGWETWLTGVAVAASALAYLLWRSGLAQLRRADTGRELLHDAAPLTRSALNDAAVLIEACCAQAGSFEAALHGVAHVLKTELGALRVTVYRVLGADDTHARVSELIAAQPGFHSTEQRIHLRRSVVGQAITTQRDAVGAGGAVALPVACAGGVVAVIELTGMQIGIDADALTTVLELAQTQLSQRAEPGVSSRRRAPDGVLSSRLGENA